MKTHRTIWLAGLVACLSPETSAQGGGAGSAQSLAASELARTVVRRSDGGTDTLVLLREPAVRRVAPPRPTPPTPTAEERATAERRAGKSYDVALVTADVYLGARALTVLGWEEDGIVHRALSNVDFRLLAPVTEFEAETSVHLWLPIVTAVEDEPFDQEVALAARQLAAGTSDYLLLDASARRSAPPRLLALLDHLHAYAEVHAVQLRSEMARRDAEQRAADERRNRPAPPRHRTIRYWLEREAKR